MAAVHMTLQEIAKRANVSTATVSRTINRVPTVNPVLARRVRRVIEKEGYYPNTHARALASGQSRILGLLVSEITNPFFPEIVETFAKLGFQHNYEIILGSISQDPRLLAVAVRQMIERRVDGIAILTFGGEDPLIKMFNARNVSVFAVDRDCPGPLLRTVRIDYEHGIREAVQHLAALGHVRIAFIAGPAHLKTAALRKDAFERCMEEIGLQVPPGLLVEGDHTLQAGVKAISELASLPDRPTAVVCSNDLTAIGVMRQAFELSLNVPRDLSVVGFDDIPLAQFMIPPLTTVQMSQIGIASIAFRALLNSTKVQAIETNLVLRCSTTLAPGRLRTVQHWRA